MESACCLAVIVGTLISPALFGADKRAKTEDGKDIILRDDGTWYYVGKSKKDKQASETYKGKRGTFTLSFVPSVWRKTDKPINVIAEAEFVHKEGDAMVMVIAERIGIPLATLKEAVIDNIRKADKEAKIIKEEKRTVNGTEVLFLMVNAKVKGIALTYMYYLYSGEAGSIQIATFTGQNLLKEFKPDMEAFLNGFKIIKK